MRRSTVASGKIFKIAPKARDHDLQGCRPAPADVLIFIKVYEVQSLYIFFCLYALGYLFKRNMIRIKKYTIFTQNHNPYNNIESFKILIGMVNNFSFQIYRAVFLFLIDPCKKFYEIIPCILKKIQPYR